MKSSDTTYVYSVPISASDDAYLEALETLSAAEKERAARFKFERHRQRWVIGRSALRQILGDHLACRPEDIQFHQRSDGKPIVGAVNNVDACKNPITDPDPRALPIVTPAPLYFNMSHSHEVAVVSVSRSQEVGCDVEWVKRIRDMDAVCRRFFSPVEQAEMANVSTADKAASFYRGWTRKEAVIKTTGEGLRADLSAFDVSLAPEKEAQLYAHRDAALGDLRWHLFDFKPDDNYVAAVATTGSRIPQFRVEQYLPKSR